MVACWAKCVQKQERRRLKAKKRTVLTAIQVALALFVAAGLVWLVYKVVGYAQAQQVYSNIESAYASELDNDTIDFAALREQYPDVVAWIKMDDVDVSYPIVHNEYYLHCDPSGASSVSGSVFLDYRNKSLDTDLYALVYGHNMRDESMFGKLDEYVSEDFYNRGTGTFRIYTPNGTYRYQIFAVNIVDPTDATYTNGFTNTQVLDAFVKQLKENSMYDTGVTVAGSDHVVTLSTCSNSDRLVLSAKRVSATGR